jgi:enolase
LRSNDTNDSFIADFALAVGASQIKLGSPVRGERNAKYNRQIRIESDLRK